jgi:transcriptional regulator with XRE-family HTH domain
MLFMSKDSKKPKNKPKARLTPLDKVIGREVAIRREALGMNQEELAEKMNISDSLINLLENGKRAWNSTTMTAAADFFNITLAELVGGAALSEEDKRDLALIRAHREARENADRAKQELKSPSKEEDESQ